MWWVDHPVQQHWGDNHRIQDLHHCQWRHYCIRCNSAKLCVTSRFCPRLICTFAKTILYTRWLTELAEKMAVQKSHVGETRHCCVLACWLHDEMCLWQVERVTSWLVSWVPIVLRLVANYTFFAFMYGWQKGHCALCHLSQEVFLNASKNYSASHLPAVIALNTWRYSPIAYCIIFFPFFSLMKACFNFCSVILFFRLDDRQSCCQSIAFGVS